MSIAPINQRNALGFKETELIDAGLKPTAPETARRIKSHNDADQLTSEWVQQGTNEYTVTHSYSPNGCLTSSVSSVSSVVYQYDYDNRISSVDSLVNYIYDASGARVGRIHNSTTNYFVIDYADGLKRPLSAGADQIFETSDDMVITKSLQEMGR